MRRPKGEVVKFLIKEILNSRPADSQEELSKLVRAELRKGEADLTITGERARLIALKIPRVKVLVHLKNGRKPKRCPSCYSGLRKVYTKNLKGRKVLVGLRCNKCSYRGSQNRWIPSRYEFRIK